MAEYNTMRAAAGSRSAAIDEGLRAHMNKVYGTMSVGMLLTFLVAWAVGTSPALLSVFRDPATLQPNILGWIVMFAPLIMVFAFGAAINKLSAAGAQVFGPAPAPIARVRGRHRVRLLVKAPKGVALQGPVAQWVGQVRGSNQFRLSVDIDPQSFY